MDQRHPRRRADDGAVNLGVQCWASFLRKEQLQQSIPIEPCVCANVAQDRIERADLERVVGWDRNVVLTWRARGQSHVAAALMLDAVAESCERLCKIEPGDVAWQFMSRSVRRKHDGGG